LHVSLKWNLSLVGIFAIKCRRDVFDSADIIGSGQTKISLGQKFKWFDIFMLPYDALMPRVYTLIFHRRDVTSAVRFEFFHSFILFDLSTISKISKINIKINKISLYFLFTEFNNNFFMFVLLIVGRSYYV